MKPVLKIATEMNSSMARVFVDDEIVLVRDPTSGFPVHIVLSHAGISNRTAAYFAALLRYPLENIVKFGLGVGVRENEEKDIEANAFKETVNRGGSSDNDVDLAIKGYRALKVGPCFPRSSFPPPKAQTQSSSRPQQAAGGKLKTVEFKNTHFASSRGAMVIIKALCARNKESSKVINIKGIKYLLEALDDHVRADGLYFLLEAEIKKRAEESMELRRHRRVFGLNEEEFDSLFLSWHEEFHHPHIIGMAAMLGSRVAKAHLLRFGAEPSEWWKYK